MKDEKTVILKSKSGEHDVLVKVNSIKKWVEKGHTVRVFIGQAGERGNPVQKLMLLFISQDQHYIILQDRFNFFDRKVSTKLLKML